jgi:hypothetical protein
MCETSFTLPPVDCVGDEITDIRWLFENDLRFLDQF